MKHRNQTVKLAVLIAGLAFAGATTAGDDLKNIGIGTGIGILGQIVQGKPLTLESAIGTALGASVGSQIGDGSGAAVASAIGGIVGDSAFQHVKGAIGTGTQHGPQGTSPQGHQQGGILRTAAGLSSPGQAVTAPVRTEITLEQAPGGAQACEGIGQARQCVPVVVREGVALLLTDHHSIYSCVGAGGRLECTATH